MAIGSNQIIKLGMPVRGSVLGCVSCWAHGVFSHSGMPPGKHETTKTGLGGVRKSLFLVVMKTTKKNAVVAPRALLYKKSSQQAEYDI